ncbi:MAG: SEC-C domain-containing protein, partial [Deltaproteobacteria bacterium]|nr:SEC-C domain-containing protein [Deltaproteobacteria bacterium]
YQAKQGGDQVVYNPTEPFLGDMSEMLADMAKEDDKEPQKKDFSVSKRRKIGRNEPCPCGSEKKYKRCCGY